MVCTLITLLLSTHKKHTLSDSWLGSVATVLGDWVLTYISLYGPVCSKSVVSGYWVFADTHYLPLSPRAAAVGGGQRGGAGLRVPGDVAVLGGAGDGQGVDAVCVAITVTRVCLTPAIPRGPHEDGTLSTTTL